MSSKSRALKFGRLGLVSLAFLYAGTCVAVGQTFGSFTAVPDQNAVILNGPIEPDSVVDFENALIATGEVKTVVLNSPGGQVVAALQIAQSIYEQKIMTLIAEESDCASACSILFFAGQKRVALGALGVHQMSSSSEGSMSGVQYLLADVLSAFDAYGVDGRVLQRMLRTPPGDMYYFSLEEKEILGIDQYANTVHQAGRVSFDSYPPSQVISGSITLPDFQGRDRWARMFRTRISDAVSAGPNFAGHFTVVEIGCGMSCRLAYVVDAASGQVFRFPYGGEEQSELGLIYASDSRLLRATWKAPYWEDVDKFFDKCISQDLLWSGKDFEILHEERFEIASGGYCSIE